MPGGARRELVVVGAGMVGCEIGAAAIESGLDTLIVEAGPRRSDRHISADPATAGTESRDLDPDFRHFLDPSTRALFGSAGYRRRAGGRSLYWRGIVLPLEEGALADWPETVSGILKGDERQPGSYAATQRALEQWAAQGEYGVQPNPLEDRLVADLRELGLAAEVTPRAVRHLPGGTWSAYSALPRIPADKLLADEPVAGVEPLDDGGFAVRLADPSRRIEADKVVLATGALGNIVLADPHVAESPGGRPRSYGVVDHVAAGCVSFEPRETPVGGPAEASAYLGFQASANSNLFVESTACASGILHDSWAMGELPSSAALRFQVASGAVELVMGKEAIGEVSLAIEALHTAQRAAISELMDLRGIAVEHWAETTYDEAARRAQAAPGTAHLYQERLGDLDHETGGLPFGSGLVDDFGRLTGLPNFYVAGTTLFPRAGAANPSLTSICLARHQAHHLIQGIPLRRSPKAEDHG